MRCARSAPSPKHATARSRTRLNIACARVATYRVARDACRAELTAKRRPRQRSHRATDDATPRRWVSSVRALTRAIPDHRQSAAAIRRLCDRTDGQCCRSARTTAVPPTANSTKRAKAKTTNASPTAVSRPDIRTASAAPTPRRRRVRRPSAELARTRLQSVSIRPADSIVPTPKVGTKQVRDRPRPSSRRVLPSRSAAMARPRR